jgi:hypothetical protein
MNFREFVVPPTEKAPKPVVEESKQLISYQKWSEMANSDPPTDKQISFLQKLYGKSAQIPATRGEASQLIDAKLKQFTPKPQQQAPAAPQQSAVSNIGGNVAKIVLTGKTFENKSEISRAGGRFNQDPAHPKTWIITVGNRKLSDIEGTLRDLESKGCKLNLFDQNNQPVQAAPQAAQPAPEEKKAEEKSPLIPDELMSEEQKAIDAKFEKLLKNPKQSHIMINALAGSGKTTMLKHLAWKYGQPGQHWLYIVFNTKNKVEAAEKFPPFVQVRTSNGFLGEVLKHKKNITQMPQTDRMVKINDKLEKARLLADGDDFTKVMTSLGIPANINAHKYGETFGRTLTKLMKSIRYGFKEQVLTLIGLAKSFAIDPRNQDALQQGIEKIMNSYDFDTELVDIKERIATSYSGDYKANIERGLKDILGYNFMEKDYKDEVKKAAVWLLNATMPHGTQQQYQNGIMQHNLGEFRDFNDDLWYAAVHANEINWPRYDVVLADEVQDFNEAQKIMLKKLHDAGAKIVAVGDPNQSIYRFRGADTGAFNNISKQLQDLSDDKEVVHGLSKNFRSRKSIIDFANSETHVKNLKGKDFADKDEGRVTKNELQYNDAFDELKQEKQRGKIKQTAFISRTNDPLVHAALKLLASGIPFVIVGKDIANDLRKHIGKVIGRFGIKDNDYAQTLAQKLDEFRGNETENHEGKSTKKVYLQELNEVTDALLSAIETFSGDQQRGTIADFKQWLAVRLGGLNVEENEKDLKEYQRKLKEENPVVLTTAHRSKGLEFSRVFILRYDLFPHKKATRKEDLEQEENSRYVAITRAQDELHILDPEGQPGYKGRD